MPYLMAAISIFFSDLFAFEVVGGSGRNADEAWFRIGSWAVLLAMLGIGLGRGTRLGAYPTASCLRVRNLIRTLDIGWEEIERFALGQHFGNPRNGLVVLKSEKTVPIAGIAGNIFEGLGGRQESQQLIDELNELLAHVPEDEQP